MKKQAQKQETPKGDNTAQIQNGLDMEASFNSIGLSMYSDDLATKLLAFSLVFGGGMEAVTQNAALNFAIRASGKKCKIEGGCIPDARLLKMIQDRIADLGDNGTNTEWLREIEERYHLSISPKCDSVPEYKRK